MFILYDPLAKKRERKDKPAQPARAEYRGGTATAPTTMQKLWFFVEPESPMMCRIGSGR